MQVHILQSQTLSVDNNLKKSLNVGVAQICVFPHLPIKKKRVIWK